MSFGGSSVIERFIMDQQAEALSERKAKELMTGEMKIIRKALAIQVSTALKEVGRSPKSKSKRAPTVELEIPEPDE